MEATYIFPTDVVQTLLTVMPLHDFQQLYYEETHREKLHQLTFAQRYQLKYGTVFPDVETTFETEEDQYLFCAYHFHGEIGLNSHLFVDTSDCMLQAIKLEDIFLFRYFKERCGGLRLHRHLRYAL